MAASSSSSEMSLGEGSRERTVARDDCIVLFCEFTSSAMIRESRAIRRTVGSSLSPSSYASTA